jgi:hypothetical protein
MDAIPYETRLRQDRIWARVQIDGFFADGGPYKTLNKLSSCLEQAGIPYAVGGDVALGEHGVDRQSASLEILVTKQGVAFFQERYEGLGYVPAFPGASKRFRSTETNVRVDFITTGEYPGDGKPKSISYPDPTHASVEINGIRVIQLEKFIELKLTSGLTGEGRLKDLADIQELIRHARLSADLVGGLHESVRQEYLKRWRAAQAPDFHNEEPPAASHS